MNRPRQDNDDRCLHCRKDDINVIEDDKVQMFKTTYTYIYRSLVVEPAQAGQRRQLLRLKIGSEDDIYNIQDNIFNIENHIIWMLKTTYAELYTQLLVIVGQRRQMLTMNLVM